MDVKSCKIQNCGRNGQVVNSCHPIHFLHVTVVTCFFLTIGIEAGNSVYNLIVIIKASYLDALFVLFLVGNFKMRTRKQKYMRL